MKKHAVDHEGPPANDPCATTQIPTSNSGFCSLTFPDFAPIIGRNQIRAAARPGLGKQPRIAAKDQPTFREVRMASATTAPITIKNAVSQGAQGTTTAGSGIQRDSGKKPPTQTPGGPHQWQCAEQ